MKMGEENRKEWEKREHECKIGIEGEEIEKERRNWRFDKESGKRERKKGRKKESYRKENNIRRKK